MRAWLPRDRAGPPLSSVPSERWPWGFSFRASNLTPESRAAAQAVRRRRGSLLAEYAATRSLIQHGVVRTVLEDVGQSVAFPGVEWQHFPAPYGRLRRVAVEDLSEPVFHSTNRAVMPVILFGVGVPGAVPVIIGQQFVPQDANVPHGQR